MKFFIREYNSTTTGSLLLLLLAIILLVLYFVFPLIFNKINLQGGTLLVNNPVYTNTSFSLGTYQDLKGSVKFDYQYAISFWFFLDANSQNSENYVSILNFGEKPNVLYNSKKNSLMITMPNNIKMKNNKINNGNEANELNDENESNNHNFLYKNDSIGEICCWCSTILYLRQFNYR